MFLALVLNDADAAVEPTAFRHQELFAPATDPGAAAAAARRSNILATLLVAVDERLIMIFLTVTRTRALSVLQIRIQTELR